MARDSRSRPPVFDRRPGGRGRGSGYMRGRSPPTPPPACAAHAPYPGGRDDGPAGARSPSACSNGSFTEACGCGVGSSVHVPGPATTGVRAKAAFTSFAIRSRRPTRSAICSSDAVRPEAVACSRRSSSRSGSHPRKVSPSFRRSAFGTGRPGGITPRHHARARRLSAKSRGSAGPAAGRSAPRRNGQRPSSSKLRR